MPKCSCSFRAPRVLWKSIHSNPREPQKEMPDPSSVLKRVWVAPLFSSSSHFPGEDRALMLELALAVDVGGGGMAGEMSSLWGASRNACPDPSAPPRQLDNSKCRVSKSMRRLGKRSYSRQEDLGNASSTLSIPSQKLQSCLPWQTFPTVLQTPPPPGSPLGRTSSSQASCWSRAGCVHPKALNI